MIHKCTINEDGDYWTRTGKDRLTIGEGHNLCIYTIDITGLCYKTRLLKLSWEVMRNIDVIFTVMICVHSYRHCINCGVD